MMEQDNGASPEGDRALMNSAPSGLRPSGFDPSRGDRPSAHGALLGSLLSEMAALGGAQDMCVTCAFRAGTMPNQMAATGLTAFKCAVRVDPDPFGCHHGMKNGMPTKLCAGYLAAQRLPFEMVKAMTVKMAALLSEHTEEDDSIRAAYDEWRAGVDPDRVLDVYQLARLYAQGIAARSAATQCGPQGESPVAESDAPKSPHNQHPNHG